MSRIVEQARQELSELTGRFRKRAIVGGAFYSLVQQQGVDVEHSVLVELIPEGPNTFSGVLIRQDGAVLEFDLDLDVPAATRWKEITEEFNDSAKSLACSKPWAREVIALEFFFAEAASRAK